MTQPCSTHTYTRLQTDGRTHEDHREVRIRGREMEKAKQDGGIQEKNNGMKEEARQDGNCK